MDQLDGQSYAIHNDNVGHVKNQRELLSADQYLLRMIYTKSYDPYPCPISGETFSVGDIVCIIYYYCLHRVPMKNPVFGICTLVKWWTSSLDCI